MNRQEVSSSDIKSVGYDEQNEVLEVEFQAGSVYQYLHVPKHEYQNLMSASSHGKHLNKFIKGSYEYVKIS